MTIVPQESLNRQKNCPVCNTEFNTKNKKFLLQQSPPVWMLKCSNCNLGTCEYLPTDKFLSKLYDPSHYEASLTSNLRLSNNLAKNIIKKCSFIFSKKKMISILDYGGGNGALCNALIKILSSMYPNLQFNALIVDVYNSISFDNIQFQSVENFQKINKKYDIVIASAVLEHLTKPSEVLDHLINLIDENGIFYARTPYEIPLVELKLGYKTSWPIHLHDMGPDFWDFVRNKNSNKIAEIQSKTSLLETSIFAKPIRTTIAFFLKLPSLFETKYIKNKIKYNGVFWKFVGGWEVIFKKVR